MRGALHKALMLAVFAALLVSCSDGFPKEFQAPEFTLKAPMTGAEVSLSDLEGRPVILYWFASW